MTEEQIHSIAQEDGCVYVIGTPGSPLVKIGRTANLEGRIGTLRRMSPVPLHVLGTLGGGHELETALHRHFAAQRAHGEWFDLGDDPFRAVQAAASSELLSAPAPNAQGDLDTIAKWSSMDVTSRPASRDDALSLGVEPGALVLVVTWRGTDAAGKHRRVSEVHRAGWVHWFEQAPDHWYPRTDGTAFFTKRPLTDEELRRLWQASSGTPEAVDDTLYQHLPGQKD